MYISEGIFVCLMVLSVMGVVLGANAIISNKDKITQFFKNLFAKGKKKKLTEPEPVTEAPISSTPPHKRKRTRLPKPKRPKIELHPLCFIEKAFGWISAKAKLVAQAIKKASASNDIDKNLFSFKQLKTLYEPTTSPLDKKRIEPSYRSRTSMLNRIDEDTVFAVGGVVLGILVYGGFSLLSSALDG